MEIYRNELANVDLAVPVYAIPGSFDVKAYDESTVLHSFSSVTAIAGGYRVTLPFSLVVNDSSFVIVWKFNYLEGSSTKAYEHRQSISVVTPYVTLPNLKIAIPEASSSTDAELVRLERRIRGVINGFTGQEFGRYVGARDVIGVGDEELRLGNRLVTLGNITGSNILYSEDGVMLPGFYAVRGDGWYIGVANPTPDGDYVFENVIRAPDCEWHHGGFKDNVVYNVTGTWGWEDVPADVTEAALILMEDELCPQSEYRDRYLKSISGDGWRYEFNPNAYYGTGSVMADQILEQYRRSTMVVI